MPNRLALETSPYLLQHKDNPVEWYPWGQEALDRARAEDKPIFLSIGYAACHWCHVMERESFEDPATAAIMNAQFVNIKVDREERPDLDSIYMQAVVALTGQGGWPMSVFLTPDGAPFYGGTYYPPRPTQGMPAFRQVLTGIADAWQTRRATVLKGAHDVLQHVRQSGVGGPSPAADELALETLEAAAQGLWREFDWAHAGWGRAPKFPQPMAIEFLLRYHALTGEANPLDMAVKTLGAMARGGIYDQLGGGFHRYATDSIWLVPHFEKMLYDNAQLARVYLHAWQLTGEAEFQRVCVEVLDYARREMTDPAGGFYSTQDADSEGHEGKFFLWTASEIDTALGPEAALFKAAFGVAPGGNFEGLNILFQAANAHELAEREGQAPAEVSQRLAAAKQKLFALREARIKPARDDKVLAGWNGLMLAAMAEAARTLDREDFRQAAVANAEFALRHLRQPDGRLLRSWRAGQARLNGYLEDYANLAEGLLATYEATFEASYFTAARQLMDYALAHFGDPRGGFFDTSDDHEQLVTRPKDIQDNATPSGGAMAVTVLLKLAALSGDRRYSEAARAALASLQPILGQYPTAFAQWLSALCFALGRPREIALVGDPQRDPELRAMLTVVLGPFRPFQVVALKRPGEPALVPLLAERDLIGGRASAAVCYDFTCRLPVTDADALQRQLSEAVSE
ncbi:MAG: thioredoxin domain-containing protein [Anaerolineales bacterium]|nr:thioredoxin domain-containing protein [Anaerolineales bacterium]